MLDEPSNERAGLVEGVRLAGTYGVGFEVLCQRSILPLDS
jgi:hypothetical protein